MNVFFLVFAFILRILVIVILEFSLCFVFMLEFGLYFFIFFLLLKYVKMRIFK